MNTVYNRVGEKLNEKLADSEGKVKIVCKNIDEVNTVCNLLHELRLSWSNKENILNIRRIEKILSKNINKDMYILITINTISLHYFDNCVDVSTINVKDSEFYYSINKIIDILKNIISTEITTERKLEEYMIEDLNKQLMLEDSCLRYIKVNDDELFSSYKLSIRDIFIDCSITMNIPVIKEFEDKIRIYLKKYYNVKKTGYTNTVQILNIYK